MADYKITFSRSAAKELEALEAGAVRRIYPKIESLSQQPRPGGCRKLTGEENLWRIRIGEYRVIYNIDDDNENVNVVRVRHRSRAYKQ
jgi:mRNA interferase RelE/StbE